MKVTDVTRRGLAIRREARDLESIGYRRHETDWEIHRGSRYNERIVDVQISQCGKYVWTKLGTCRHEWWPMRKHVTSQAETMHRQCCHCGKDKWTITPFGRHS